MVEPVLAWSAAEDGGDELRVPRGWRLVCRNAIAVVAGCVAVAGVIMAADLHWFPQPVPQSQVDAQQPPMPAAMLPDLPINIAPAVLHWSPVGAEHLQPPVAAVDPNADAVFLTGLQRTGSQITSVPDAIASGHSACTDLANGFTSEQVAVAVMSHNHTLTLVNALGMVYSAATAYCPEYAGR